MTLRLTDDGPRRCTLRAEREVRSTQDVARQALREYIEGHSRAEFSTGSWMRSCPRYAEALERLGQ